jgi:hypothetical protein
MVIIMHFYKYELAELVPCLQLQFIFPSSSSSCCVCIYFVFVQDSFGLGFAWVIFIAFSQDDLWHRKDDDDGDGSLGSLLVNNIEHYCHSHCTLHTSRLLDIREDQEQDGRSLLDPVPTIVMLILIPFGSQNNNESFWRK